MTFNRGQIARIYGEVEKRISLMIRQREIESNEEMQNVRALMREGVYSTLITVADNWPDIVRWLAEIEK